SKGIKKEYSNARTPQQNMVAERKNRSLIEEVRTMLADSKLPTMFWTEAVRTAYLNRVLEYKKPQLILQVHKMLIQTTDCDEQVIIVPSYPSHSIQGTAHIDTFGDEVDDSPLTFANEIFQKELARLKSQEQRATSNAETLGLGFANDDTELQKRASVKTVPLGSIPVPTGSILVPVGDTMVSTDDVLVHTSSPTDLFFDDKPTTRFPSPSDLGNHDSSPGIFSSSSYDDEFGAALNNVASTVEV
nr:putative ribonuclease H-like domain-containing protein [Tanacetum cinerariifolium]